MSHSYGSTKVPHESDSPGPSSAALSAFGTDVGEDTSTGTSGSWEATRLFVFDVWSAGSKDTCRSLAFQKPLVWQKQLTPMKKGGSIRKNKMKTQILPLQFLEG
jgi:hypothetical protein